MDKKAAISVGEMAKMLGISKPKAYELANRADFPKITLGRRIIIPVETFMKWLDNEAMRG